MERLIALAKENKVEEFKAEFAKQNHENLHEWAYDLGKAAVDGKSLNIIKLLSAHYDTPFEIFSSWLRRAIKNQDLDTADYIENNVIHSGVHEAETALKTGNLDLIERFYHEEADLTCFWKSNPSLEKLQALFELVDDQYKFFSAMRKATLPGDDPTRAIIRQFLLNYRTEHFSSVVCLGVQTNLDVWSDLGKNNQLFPIFVEEGRDDLAMKYIEKYSIDDMTPSEILDSAAHSGCVNVLKYFAKHITDVNTLLWVGISHDSIIEFLLTFNPPIDTDLMQEAIIHGSDKVVGWLLSRYHGDYQPIALEIVEQKRVNLIAMIKDMVDWKDEALMLTAAKNRDMDTMLKLAELGGSLSIAIRNRVERYDSHIASQLYPLVSKADQEWTYSIALSKHMRLLELLPRE